MCVLPKSKSECAVMLMHCRECGEKEMYPLVRNKGGYLGSQCY